MTEKTNVQIDGAKLRRLAEERREKRTEKGPRPAIEAQRLLQELEIHKIELEMQGGARQGQGRYGDCGTISFQSEQGVGSTFTFIVPLEQAECLDAHISSEPRSATAGSDPRGERVRRLLLAEDDATISEILGVLLRRENYQVDCAENGLRAVELWQQGEYDLVLMDVQMPLLNGFEATRAIREQERESGGLHTPIIAMTAHAQREDEQKCLDAGMDAHISKPIDLPLTLQVIRNIFRQNPGAALVPAHEGG
jgi:CheY-like chemotaxis protein